MKSATPAEQPNTGEWQPISEWKWILRAHPFPEIANKPFVLDVHVDANVHPPATGVWQLPPTPYNEPVFGQRFVPDVPASAK